MTENEYRELAALMQAQNDALREQIAFFRSERETTQSPTPAPPQAKPLSQQIIERIHGGGGSWLKHEPDPDHPENRIIRSF